MIRNIDDIGRLCIPIEIRRKLGIIDDTLVNIELIENKIVITKEASKNNYTIEELENLRDQISEKIKELRKENH